MIPLAPLKFGDVLNGAFSTMGKYWKQLFGMGVALYGGAALLMAAAVAVAYSAVADPLERLVSLGYGDDPDPSDIVSLVTAGGVLAVLGIIAMMIVSGLMYAAVPVVLQEAVLGRPVDFSTVWRRAWSSVAPVIGTLLLTTLIVVVPVVLIVVACVGVIVAAITLDSGSGGAATAVTIGVLGALATGPLAAWLWVKFCLAPAVVVFEGQRPVAALRRSSQLVRGDWWRIFGITLLVYMMAAMAGYFIQMPLSLLGMFPSIIGTSSLDDDPSPAAIVVAMGGYFVATLLGQMVSQIISTTFPQLVTGLLYVDRRMRTENLGPVLAEAAGVPQQGSAPYAGQPGGAPYGGPQGVPYGDAPGGAPYAGQQGVVPGENPPAAAPDADPPAGSPEADPPAGPRDADPPAGSPYSPPQ